MEANGDERAKKEFELYEDRFARLISVMIGIVDPEVIVFGGGMSNVGRLYDNIPKLLPKYTFSDKIRNKILLNTHGILTVTPAVLEGQRGCGTQINFK